MIVAMKRCSLVMFARDAEQGLRCLRRLGSLHLEHVRPPAGKDLAALEEDLALAEEAIAVLLQEKAGLKKTVAAAPVGADWKKLARHIIDSQKKLSHLDEYSRSLAEGIRNWERWGDFDPQAIQKLREDKIEARLYQIPLRALPGIDNRVALEVIFTSGSNAFCLAVSRSSAELPYPEIPLPKMGLEEMRRRFSEDQAMIRFVRQELDNSVGYLEGFCRLREGLQKESSFCQARAGMGEEEELAYLQGYLPEDAAEALTLAAREQGWGVLINDPGEEENPPVLLRNPRWISLINPVFRFLDIFPGYRELDISLVFLIFFSIFFGILIGDAGYGLVYCLLTAFLHWKNGRKMPDRSLFFLLYLLSFCAMIWGSLTGTFFGQEWVLKAGYRPLVPELNDQKFLQAFCFFLGALHLSIAHLWKLVLKLPAWAALVDLGWICILWASFLVARMLVLGDAFPGFGKWLIIAGVVLVVLFTHPQKNLLKGIGEGLGNLALSLMNNFTDVVSYVRLFAVGLAGVSIAEAFNAMAGNIGQSGGIYWLAAALVAVIGQSLGVVLGPVSVLVHGVRLNVLEFSGHSGVSWSGQAYRPFKE